MIGTILLVGAPLLAGGAGIGARIRGRLIRARRSGAARDASQARPEVAEPRGILPGEPASTAVVPAPPLRTREAPAGVLPGEPTKSTSATSEPAQTEILVPPAAPLGSASVAGLLSQDAALRGLELLVTPAIYRGGAIVGGGVRPDLAGDPVTDASRELGGLLREEAEQLPIFWAGYAES